MILEKYEYNYALVPREVARQMGIGWRKATAEGMVMINNSELKSLLAGGTFEERVSSVGGKLLESEQARYLVKTTNMSLDKNNPAKEAPSEDEISVLPEEFGKESEIEDTPADVPIEDVSGTTENATPIDNLNISENE